MFDFVPLTHTLEEQGLSQRTHSFTGRLKKSILLQFSQSPHRIVTFIRVSLNSLKEMYYVHFQVRNFIVGYN